MAMSKDFQLGLLAERKLNWRAMASSYGFVILLILLLINLGLIWPDRLQIAQKYHVMEIIPVPGLRPKPLKMKTPRLLQAQLLSATFPAPKLTVPRELRAPRPQPQQLEPPKVALNDFTPAVLKQVPGGARPSLIVHTGEFGSSAAPTVNAPIQKAQPGGFGEPNGIPGKGKPNGERGAEDTGMVALA